MYFTPPPFVHTYMLFGIMSTNITIECWNNLISWDVPSPLYVLYFVFFVLVMLFVNKGWIVKKSTFGNYPLTIEMGLRWNAFMQSSFLFVIKFNC